jgi:predicted aldo/keto reductase-like oxidoreductase
MERRELLTMFATLQVAANAQTSNGMIMNFGTTRERVSALGLGDYQMGVPKEESECIRIVRSALDRGVTFLEASEIRMGKALKDGYRKRVFLMTKYNGRPRAMVAKQIDESLRGRADLALVRCSATGDCFSKTKEAAMTGEFEPFKTTTQFDGTVQHPEWMG